ncbi:YcxB family protein [Marinilactibacillus sp. Marseille-P9653]|uniref:YcxB family protein n=1 Tax=Marinilactibacillus sp. Marseille-P9653 TaxID=2866583 RepID=UPI001CE3EFBD|nr:YcxB family protein [Marinilactibacillus sp. Marseille-P9653]
MIEYEITEEDYINFNLHHVQNSPSQKKLFNLVAYILPVLLVPGVYFLGTEIFEQSGLYWAIMAVGIYVLWIYVYPKIYRKTLKNQSLKLLKEGDNSSLFGKKKLNIMEDPWLVIEEDMTSSLPKSRIKEVKEYDDMILLYLSAVSVHIIPKRYLSEKDISNIRTILE